MPSPTHVIFKGLKLPFVAILKQSFMLLFLGCSSQQQQPQQLHAKSNRIFFLLLLLRHAFSSYLIARPSPGLLLHCTALLISAPRRVVVYWGRRRWDAPTHVLFFCSSFTSHMIRSLDLSFIGFLSSRCDYYKNDDNSSCTESMSQLAYNPRCSTADSLELL